MFRRLRGGRPSKGQALAELAIVLPVMLMLLLGAIDLGRVFYAQITITNAAKEGALVAATGGKYVPGAICSSANTVMCGVLTEAKGGFVEVDRTKVTQSPSSSVACPTTASVGSTVSVTVQAPFHILTPFIGAIVGGQDITVGATAHAECAVLPSVTLLPVPTPTPCALKLVPTVDGLAAPTAANNAITGAGLTPGGVADLTTGQKGSASNQSPAAGTCVASGSTVTYHYRPN
jgi:Flp pilus assembly protein TadG